MFLSAQLKAVAGIGGVVAVLMFTAAPAVAQSPATGNEQITEPVSVPVGTLVGTQPYEAPEDSLGNLTPSGSLQIVGTGYAPGWTVWAMECDGKSPESTGYSVAMDCDALTSSSPEVPGTEGWPSGQVEFSWTGVGQAGPAIFHGIGPNDQFNCLNDQDNPAATSVNNSGAGPGPAIDPTSPSWGSTQPLVPGIGGGAAPCQVRVGYSSVNLDVSSDKYFPVDIPNPAAIPPPPPSLQLLGPVQMIPGQLVGTVPYVATEDANGNPISSDLTIVAKINLEQGMIFSPVSMECDGTSPSSAGYSVTVDCDPLTLSPVVATVGPNELQVGATIFRGVSPDDLFNCLAPQDDPSGTTVNVPGLPAGATPATIDPTKPSWGSDRVNPVGGNGGSAPCQERVTFTPSTLNEFGPTSDEFFPVELPQSAPAAAIPESPVTVALPIGAAVLFGAAGIALYGRRRSNAPS